jgi:hypothetical protein
MDPYSADGGTTHTPTLNTTPEHTTNHYTELVNMHTAFIQGQYQQVIDFDTSIFSSPNQPSAQILKYRAQLALGDYSSVASAISSSDASSNPSLAAVKTFLRRLKLLLRFRPLAS